MGDVTPGPEGPVPNDPIAGHAVSGTGGGSGVPHRRGISRRQVLGVLGATGVVGVGAAVAGRRIFTDDVAARNDQRPAGALPAENTTSTTATTTAPDPPPAPSGALWSDPQAWGGKVPGEGDVAVVSTDIVLDVDAKVAGVTIEPGGRLTFDPNEGHTLQSTGNVLVRGTLQMRPASPGVLQTLLFAGVDEAAFEGGHTMEPIGGDVGLWVLAEGTCDLAGSAKNPWTRLTGGAEPGATTIAVQDATGWQVGDEVVVAPMEPSTVEEHWMHHDRRTITAVSGNQVSLDDGLTYPHQPVTVREGVTHTAEVLNLSRNVRIEGTPDGRAHVIFLHSLTPQQISHVGLRHLGPRYGGDEGVQGRYALHFHMCDDGSRGSKVTGVTAYDCGNHAFVPHLSNGVTFERCVSHDTVDDAFWWDPAPEDSYADSVPTSAAVYDHCVASHVKEGDDGYSTTGFFLGAGADNVARGCVAVGTMGNTESASGFHWPDKSRSEFEEWVFEDCVAHNCKSSGIYFWQNNVGRTVVDRFTSYYNNWGIWAGAYSNLVSYRDCTLFHGLQGGLEVNAVPEEPRVAGETITYEGMYVDQAGLTEYAAAFHGPLIDSEQTTRVTGCRFMGGTKAQVAIQNGPPAEGGDPETQQNYEFIDCSYAGNPFWLEDEVRTAARIRVSDSANGTVMLHRKGSAGSARPEWNATATPA